MNKKLTYLVISLAAASSLCAMNVDTNNFYTRDYLDFGQNLGQFTPGATNITITDKHGNKVEFPNLPFPDFNASSLSRNQTSVGNAYVAGAKHVLAGANSQNYGIVIGSNHYTTNNHYHYGKDSSFSRANKYIVEGSYKPVTLEEIKNHIDNYKIMYDGAEKVLMYRTGKGRMVWGDWNTSEETNFSQSPNNDYRSGNFWLANANQIGGNNNLFSLNQQGRLPGHVASGDSGSPIFVFNNKTKEWEIAGTLYGVSYGNNVVYNALFNKVDGAELEKYKKEYEVFKTPSSSEYTLDKDKDSVFTAGGDVKINSAMNQGIGGLILRGENLALEVKGNGSWQGAGVDVAKNSTIKWGVELKSDLHKVGEGTLEVVKSTNAGLQMGEGTAILSAKNSFTSLHLVNPNGVVKINANDAIHYNDVFFGKSGGTLDLNGHNAQMNTMKALNQTGTITNKSDKKSTLTLTPQQKNIVHGTIKGNIALDVKGTSNVHTAFDGALDVKEMNALNQMITFQGKPVPHATWNNDLNCSSTPINLPGFTMPSQKQFGQCSIGYFINQFDKNIADKNAQSYIVANKTVMFEQPDWLQKTFKIGNMSAKNSQINIERNANVIGNFKLENSTLTWNSGNGFIDENDSKSYTQNVREGNMGKGFGETISYDGEIIATNNSKIISNGIQSLKANINLANSSFNAPKDNVALKNKGIALKNSSTFNAQNLNIQKVNTKIITDNTSKLKVGGISINDAKIVFDVQQDELANSIHSLDSKIRIENNSKVPSNLMLSNSTLEFDNLDTSKTTLNGANFSNNSYLIARNLTHKQGMNYHWGNLDKINVANELNLTNVGSGTGDNKFLALDVKDKALILNDNSKINVSFKDTFQTIQNDSSIVKGKEYDLIATKKLTKEGVTNINFIGQNANSDIQAISKFTDTGVKFHFTKENQLTNKKISEKINNDSPVLTMLLKAQPKDELIKNVAFSENNIQAFNALSNKVAKIEDNFQTASKITQANQNAQMVNTMSSLINNRVNIVRTATSMQPMGEKYASLDNDLFATELPYYSGVKPLNNLWANIGGGYFDGGGYLKYFSSNFGYDKTFENGNSSYILGGLVSLGSARSSSSVYTDDMNTYGFGFYGVMDIGNNEFQANINYMLADTEKSDNIGNRDKDMNHTFSIQGIYKYAFALDEDRNHFIKPLIGIEYVNNRIAGYQLNTIAVQDYDSYVLNGSIGVEYLYKNDRGLLSAGLTMKNNLASSDDMLYIGIRGGNDFIGYQLNAEKPVFNLNLMGDYHINQSWNIGLATNFQTNTNGDTGVSGAVKLEYKF